MIGFSRMAGGLVRGVLSDMQVVRTSMGETSAATTTWPTSAGVGLEVTLPLSEMLDAGKQCEVRLEYSTNGGVLWRTWGGFTWVGTPGRDTNPDLQWPTAMPTFSCWPAPPSGALTRVKLIPSGDP